MVTIQRTEVSQHAVRIELSDGKVVLICPHDEYLHLHFSGLGSLVVVAERSGANQANLFYRDEKAWLSSTGKKRRRGK